VKQGGSGLTTVLKYPYFIAVGALLPLIRPALPLNTSLLDFVNGPFILMILIWLVHRRAIEIRLGGPAVIVLIGSLLAMFNSGALASNAVALLQEVYLFMFLITVVNVIDDERDRRVLTYAWLWFAVLEGFLTLGGLRGQGEVRALGTFENPNMAASYLGVSAFLVLQVGWPRWPARALLVLPMIGGMLAAKSLSALGGLMLGSAAVAFVYWLWTRSNVRKLIGILLVVGLVAGTGLAVVLANSEHFLDRLPKSAGERSVVWSSGIRSFLDNPLGIGVGPAGFREVGYVSGGHYGIGRRISLHDDYLAFLVERGVIGFAGLLLLFASLGRALLGLLERSRTDDELISAAALTGMFVFILADSAFHEVTHYRHVWLAFSLILASERLQQGRLAGGERG